LVFSQALLALVKQHKPFIVIIIILLAKPFIILLAIMGHIRGVIVVIMVNLGTSIVSVFLLRFLIFL